MAERESIGGAFEALQSRVYEVGHVVRGFEEVAECVQEGAALPAWLSAMLAQVQALDAALERLEPHVRRRTPEARAARKMLAMLPRRGGGA